MLQMSDEFLPSKHRIGIHCEHLGLREHLQADQGKANQITNEVSDFKSQVSCDRSCVHGKHMGHMIWLPSGARASGTVPQPAFPSKWHHPQTDRHSVTEWFAHLGKFSVLRWEREDKALLHEQRHLPTRATSVKIMLMTSQAVPNFLDVPLTIPLEVGHFLCIALLYRIVCTVVL